VRFDHVRAAGQDGAALSSTFQVRMWRCRGPFCPCRSALWWRCRSDAQVDLRCPSCTRPRGGQRTWVDGRASKGRGDGRRRAIPPAHPPQRHVAPRDATLGGGMGPPCPKGGLLVLVRLGRLLVGLGRLLVLRQLLLLRGLDRLDRLQHVVARRRSEFGQVL